MGDNGAMSSDDDVVRLNHEGVSIRAIAERLGLSESRVHRITASAAEEDDDLDAPERALLDAADSYEAVPPFTYVRSSPVWSLHRQPTTGPSCTGRDTPTTALEERPLLRWAVVPGTRTLTPDLTCASKPSGALFELGGKR
jgi:hypothetical protein